MTHGSIPCCKHHTETLIKRHFSKQNAISPSHTSKKRQKALKLRENMLSGHVYILIAIQVCETKDYVMMWCYFCRLN